MNIIWNGSVFNTKLVETEPYRIKTGDFLLYGGQLCKVVTVQKECPYLENLHRHFIQFTLQDRAGHIIPTREIKGKREVHRVVR